VRYVYEHALKGYAASIAEGNLGALAADGRVASIERDAEVTMLTTQTGATWGLDRIDQTSLPLSTTFSYSKTSAGVKAYTSNAATNTISGTSMATPHTAGVAALYLQSNNGRGTRDSAHGAVRQDDEEHRHRVEDGEQPPAITNF